MAESPTFRGLTPSFIYLLLTATLGPLLFGYHLAELNAPQEVITCAKKDINATLSNRLTLATSRSVATGTPSSDDILPQCISMDPIQFGLITSFFTLGGLIGALAGGPITSTHGRLRGMILSSLFAFVGPICEALAPGIGVFALGRFISGVGAGSATVIVPIYVSEISPPLQRGFFGTLTQVMINVGILLTQVLGLFLSHGQMWRVILAVAGAIAISQTMLLLFGGQESPKWLADHKDLTQARHSLRTIRGSHVDLDEEIRGWNIATARGAQDEEQTLLNDDESAPSRETLGARRAASDSVQRSRPLGFVAVLQHPHYRPAVFSVIMIMLAQQFCGINSIVMYGVGLLSDLLAANSALLNIAVAVLNIVVTVASAPLVEKFGRRPCLILSISGMGINSVLLGIGIMKHIPLLSAVAVILFVASFGLGLGPVPFILSSELVGAEAVGATQSWALGANWTATFIVAQFFPALNANLGKGQVYFIFAAFAALFASFTAWYIPETKGKHDADEVWGRKKSVERQD